MKKSMFFVMTFFWLFSTTAPAAPASDHEPQAEKPAIVLASFGTTVPEAVDAIVNIQKKVQAAFPGVPVRITFTSNLIRKVWKERQGEAQVWLDKGIPEEILYVENIFSTFGRLLDEGCRDIVVQPTHMFFMEQSHDLMAHVNAFQSIRTIKDKWRPFRTIALGRPALGSMGETHDYHEDLEKGLKTLAGDVALAKQHSARLLYMAHGNAHWSVGIYGEAAKVMKRLYPEVETFFAAVEGYPGLDDVLPSLAAGGPGTVMVKPFMIVAGDHAINDMAGDETDSWKSILTGKGFKVLPVLEGLGENDAFAGIFVDHIRDAAEAAGIALPEPR